MIVPAGVSGDGHSVYQTSTGIDGRRADLENWPGGLVTIAFKIRPLDPTPGNGTLFGNHGNLSGARYNWAVNWNLDVASRVSFTQADGVGLDINRIVNGSDLADGTSYSCLLTHDGSTVRWYVDDTSVDNSGSSQTAVAHGSIDQPLRLYENSPVIGSFGAYCALGQIMVWPGIVLDSDEIAQYHAGVTIPRFNYLALYIRGVTTPVVDEILPDTFIATSGELTLLSDPVDYMFGTTKIKDFRQIASERLLSRSSERSVHSITVPRKFMAKMDVGDVLNVADAEIPRPASVVENLDSHYMTDEWRRLIAQAVEMTYIAKDKKVKLLVRDLEPGLATYACSLQLPFGSVPDEDGLFELDVGGSALVVEKPQVSYIDQNSNLVNALSFGNKFIGVNPGLRPMGPIGMLVEDEATNDCLNSAFSQGTPGTPYNFDNITEVLNGGVITVDTARLAFRGTDVSTQVYHINGQSSSDHNYLEWSYSVTSADVFRRVEAVYFDNDSLAILNWQLQRDSDNWYWNDSSGAWQSGAVWNSFPNSTDWAEGVSKKIEADENTTWNLRVGKDHGNTSDQKDTSKVAHVQCHVGNLAHSPVPTVAAAVTAGAVTVKRILDVDMADPVRQLCHATRRTNTVWVIAAQNGDDLEDDDELAIIYEQWGSSEGVNYDVLLYQKLSGQNVRFSFERFTSSTFRGRATLDLEIARGTLYRIGYGVTSSAQENGLAENTLFLRVDDTNGVSAVASAAQDDTERHTEIWFGCAPDGTGYKRANNWLVHFRSRQRVVFPEELEGLTAA